jgi:hypothetical protein
VSPHHNQSTPPGKFPWHSRQSKFKFWRTSHEYYSVHTLPNLFRSLFLSFLLHAFPRPRFFLTCAFPLYFSLLPSCFTLSFFVRPSCFPFISSCQDHPVTLCGSVVFVTKIDPFSLHARWEFSLRWSAHCLSVACRNLPPPHPHLLTMSQRHCRSTGLWPICSVFPSQRNSSICHALIIYSVPFSRPTWCRYIWNFAESANTEDRKYTSIFHVCCLQFWHISSALTI